MEILGKNLKGKDQRVYVLLTCAIIEVWDKMYYLTVDLNELRSSNKRFNKIFRNSGKEFCVKVKLESRS